MNTTLTRNPTGLERVPECVGAQAAATPEALAVAAGHRRLTSGRLEARAERLANRLRSLGVGHDVIVGLHFESSPAMVVGALGILKAGGAYLALDAAHPLERLAFLLNDAKPRLVVTADHLADRLPRGDWLPIPLDPEGRDGGPEPPERRRIPWSSEDLAYVIYTSGSTGQPKGVEITHGGLMNLVSWHQRAFSITRDDRATQLSALGFDAAVWELWPYLTAGASVHLSDGVAANDPEAVRDWLILQKITICFLPT